jgi:hypothetical protein
VPSILDAQLDLKGIEDQSESGTEVDVELNVEEQDATRYVKYHTLESRMEVQECETEAAPD